MPRKAVLIFKAQKELKGNLKNIPNSFFQFLLCFFMFNFGFLETEKKHEFAIQKQIPKQNDKYQPSYIKIVPVFAYTRYS